MVISLANKREAIPRRNVMRHAPLRSRIRRIVRPPRIFVRARIRLRAFRTQRVRRSSSRGSPDPHLAGRV